MSYPARHVEPTVEGRSSRATAVLAWDLLTTHPTRHPLFVRNTARNSIRFGLLTVAISQLFASGASAAAPRAGNQCKKRELGTVVAGLRCTTVTSSKFVWPRPKTLATTAPKATEFEPSDDCDPNYTPCVPIDSDVDCSSGKGNGPSYAHGPVRVIGSDIYGLDSNGDGIGCERG